MDYSNLIGIPYDEDNCWTLTQKFYEQVFNIKLKHYFTDLPSDRNEMMGLIYTNIGDFERVTDEPRFGDIILMKVWGVESHIAIYIGEGKVLHTTRPTGSVIDRVDRLRQTITGYWRVKIDD